MLRFNFWGLGMLVATGIVAGVGSLALRLDDQVVMIAVGLSLIVVDVLLRLRARTVAAWWYQSQFGGTLFSLPAWALGTVMVVINIGVAALS